MAQVNAADLEEKKKFTREMKALEQQLAAWDETGQRQVVALVKNNEGPQGPFFNGCNLV
ncbi:hypothetical protein SEF58_00515 [Neomoorella humiferrea]|uniref:hypothetical protein n=1 Tax=Neomoorella humiferrea TaxID=676965 RepID=UPI003D8A20CA